MQKIIERQTKLVRQMPIGTIWQDHVIGLLEIAYKAGVLDGKEEMVQETLKKLQTLGKEI